MNSAIIEAVSWTLVHSIWQAAVIAIILAMILPAIRRNGYTVSIASLAILVVACGVTFAWHHSWSINQVAFVSSATKNVTSGESSISQQPGSLPPEIAVLAGQSSSLVDLPHETHEHAHPYYVGADGQTETSSIATMILANWQLWLVIGWLIGTSVQLLRMLISWFRLHRIHRTSDAISTRPDLAQRFGTLGPRLGLRKKIKWLLSRSIDVPIVSGVFRPIVVVPTSMMTGMTPDQVDAVLLHELAHVRRHDFLINLFQMLVETFLFFNPAVWWISRQIRIQREYRCDDLASSACADKKQYAWALAALEQLRASPAVAMAADGGQPGSLLDRINRLVAPAKPKRRRLSGVTCFACLMLVLLTTGVIGIVSTWAIAGPSDEESHMSRDQEQLREIIGRFDSDYWDVVDIRKLIKDNQVALSPKKNWLALVREKQLYVIESKTGQVLQQRPLNLQLATVEWDSNEKLLINDGAEISLLVKEQFIKVVTNADRAATFNSVTKAFVGYPYKQRNGWGATRNREGLVSLAGLTAGKHRIVLAPSFSDRNVTEVMMPLPKSETVVQRKLVPPSDWVSNNFQFVASAKQHDGETTVTVRIKNFTGGPMTVSDYDLRLEVFAPNHASLWGMSPVWRKELNRKAKKVTVANGESGAFIFSWQDVLRNGLWHDEQHMTVMKAGKGILSAPPLGQISLRVWFRNAGVLPINVTHPTLAFHNNAAAAKELGIPAPPNRINKDDATVREYVMLQLRKYIIRNGKIGTAKINMAIDVVSTDGSRFPEVRKLLLEALEKSYADKNNGDQTRKRILEVIGRILGQNGQHRWSHEYSKRPGAFPQQRAIPTGDVLYTKSPYLEHVVKLAGKATRADIDYYVMAIRNAHHPQTIEFLLDVINEPTDSVSMFAEPNGKPNGRPGIDFPTASPANFDPAPAAKGKWTDHSGGGWENAKLIAAIGLAELGRAEGVQWLIEKTRPNDAGNYKLRPMCNRALQDLTAKRGEMIQRGQPVKGFDGWTAWWRENKNRFTLNRVYSMGMSVNSQQFRAFQMPPPNPNLDRKPASFDDVTDGSWTPLP